VTVLSWLNNEQAPGECTNNLKLKQKILVLLLV